MNIQRRTFLAVTAGAAFGAGAAANWGARKWKIDSRCVLPRGRADEFDGSVVGDPCVVWDEEVETWRMFYFAGARREYTGAAAHPTVAGMALSKSVEEIAPGEWKKAGRVELADTPGRRSGHKFWVVLDPKRANRAAKIQGRYWGLHVSGGSKHIYAVHAEHLAGPWTGIAEPILSPNTEGAAPDGKHCDTPTAFWFEDLNRVVIFYKAYPLRAQQGQPRAPFGSSSVIAHWQPGDPAAKKGRQILVPGRGNEFCRGWVGGFQLLGEPGRWYALLNGSPTSPEDLSHREPAPSLGGWAVCNDRSPDGEWRIDTDLSPFLYPEKLTSEQLAAGLGVNFWRHHLLVTPGSKARIFFNSGQYGTEQMYSLIPA